MRKLLSLLVLAAFALTSYGQNQNIEAKRVKVNENFRVPLDTLVNPQYLYEMRFRSQDTSFYINMAQTGQKWRKLGTGTTSNLLTAGATLSYAAGNNTVIKRIKNGSGTTYTQNSDSSLQINWGGTLASSAQLYAPGNISAQIASDSTSISVARNLLYADMTSALGNATIEISKSFSKPSIWHKIDGTAATVYSWSDLSNGLGLTDGVVDNGGTDSSGTYNVYVEGTEGGVLKKSSIRMDQSKIVFSAYDSTIFGKENDYSKPVYVGYGQKTYIIRDWQFASKDYIDSSLSAVGGSLLEPNEPILANTKAKITFDEKGLVVLGEDLIEDDLPAIQQSKITGLPDALAAKEPVIPAGTVEEMIVGDKSLVSIAAKVVQYTPNLYFYNPLIGDTLLVRVNDSTVYIKTVRYGYGVIAGTHTDTTIFIAADTTVGVGVITWPRIKKQLDSIAAVAGIGEANTLSNVGAGSQIAKTKVGVDIPLRTIVAGANITVTQNADDITIATSGAVGEANTTSNTGAGAQVAKTKVGVDLPMRTIVAGSNVTVTQGTDIITIDASGGAAVDDDAVKIYQALGSTLKAEHPAYGQLWQNQGTQALVDNRVYFQPIYLRTDQTLTGVAFYQAVLGSYTGDQSNQVGLYTISGTTLTRVAVSTSSATLWSSGSGGAIKKVAFSSTYAATAGVYFVAWVYNNSAQTTAPTLASGDSFFTQAVTADFTTNNKLLSYVAGNSLPATQAMSGTTAITHWFWYALY
jgi:hypothetical protein